MPENRSIEYATPACRDDNREQRSLRLVALWAWSFLAAIPASVLLTTHVMFILAAIHLGRFPRYNNPEPKGLPPWVFLPERLSWLGFVVGLVAIALACWYLFRRSTRAQMVALIVTNLALWAVLFADPFGALEWVVD